MWITINIILIILGVCLIAYAKHIDSAENYKALFLFGFGVAVTLTGIISSIAKAVL